MRDAMYEDSTKGNKIRKKIGDRILELTNIENEAIGIEAGYRYDHSPVICYDGEGAPPPFGKDKLQPSTFPRFKSRFWQLFSIIGFRLDFEINVAIWFKSRRNLSFF